MNILAIDTSGPAAGCAVMKDGKIVHMIAMNQGLTHSETVMPAVDAAMTAAGLTCADIDCFAVVAGPGSFTGVRIGICAAKGMAHAVGKPCARIDALEALAMNAFGFDGIVCPILDARRGQVYCAAFDTKDGQPVRILENGAMALTDFVKLLPNDRRLMFVGDGVMPNIAYLNTIENALIPPEHIRTLKADTACLLAAMNPEAWMPTGQLTPIYLRLPQAERERNARLRQASAT